MVRIQTNQILARQNNTRSIITKRVRVPKIAVRWSSSAKVTAGRGKSSGDCPTRTIFFTKFLKYIHFHKYSKYKIFSRDDIRSRKALVYVSSPSIIWHAHAERFMETGMVKVEDFRSDRVVLGSDLRCYVKWSARFLVMLPLLPSLLR